MANILVVDDDPGINNALSRTIKSVSGCDVTSCYFLHKGLETARSERFDLIFLDVRMPDGNGLEALPVFKELPSRPEIIILTGFADKQDAALAINHGAWDYLEKPFEKEELLSTLRQALQYRQDKANSTPTATFLLDGIVGKSPSIVKCIEQVHYCTAWDCNILITGETGTGKGLFAKTIHKNSGRNNFPLIVVDCTVLPDNLVESSLFGHQRGSFTGADCSQKGLIERADGGTLFLDEIGDLPYPVQGKFLRVLETRKFRPVGAKHELQSDFRLISATNRDIGQMVRDKTFREDLYHRIQGSSIHLAPLRERLCDLEELVDYHLDIISKKKGLSPKKLSTDFKNALYAYPWPGNVRELLYVLETSLIRAQNSSRLMTYHLPEEIRIHLIQNRLGMDSPESAIRAEPFSQNGKMPTLKAYRGNKVAQIEKEYLLELMDNTGGDMASALEISGVSKSRLYKLMQKHGIKRSTFR